ncbi:MAG: MFS transporter [Anaerolineae bacterium]|nr:MFS transporter [Gloeobacterales cyanobacterium ES-bin-313]
MVALRRPSPLIFIFLTVFIDLMGGSLLIPVLPFLVERFRSDALTIGWLTASFSIAQFLAAPVLGSLSDRYGRRPVLLICVLGTALGYFVFGWAKSLWVLFLARIIDGITGGVISTAQAYIADISTPEERTKNFGLIGAAFGLGFILGPTIGGVLARIDLNLPVFFAGGISLVNLVLGYFTLNESLPPERRRPISAVDFNPLRSLANLLDQKSLQGILIGFFLYNFAFAGFTGIFTLAIRDRFGWGPDLAAWLFAFIGIISTIVQGGLIRKLVPAFGETRLAISGLALIALAYGLVCVIPSGPWLYLTQGILAVGIGLTAPSLRGVLSNRTSPENQGRVLGGAQALASLGQVVGPLWAGWSYDYLGRLVPFWVGAIWQLAAIALVVIGLRVKPETIGENKSRF